MNKHLFSKKISNETLLGFNQRGLIPGPDESDVDFIQRADYCQNLEQELQNKVPFPLSSEKKIPLEPCQKTAQLFDIFPDWVPVFFSNEKLLPWHGGCAWIFQLDDQSPTAALFQMRESFKDKRHYLGMYDRDEIMAHELAHIGRMMFEEPKFEEILAYKTTHSSFRRWLGPIVQSSLESMLFVLSLFIVLFFDIFSLYYNETHVSTIAFWSKTIPLGLLFLALIRLWKRQSQYQKCLSQLQHVFKENANAVIYRLIDKEIISFGQLAPIDILNYVKKEKENSLRWYVIDLAYSTQK